MRLQTTALLLLFAAAMASNEQRFEDSTGCGNDCEFCDMESDACSRCRSGYYYDQLARMCQQASSIQNCVVYQHKNLCLQCDEGFTVLNNKCEACLPNCKRCDNSILQCDACKKGQGNLNSITKTCTVQCNVLNCEQCGDGNSNACQACAQGYRLNALFLCEKCLLDNCGSCSADISQCDAVSGVNPCLDGYFLNAGQCVKCDSGCRRCSLAGVCLACNVSDSKFMWMDMTCKRATLLALAAWLWGLLAIAA